MRTARCAVIDGVRITDRSAEAGGRCCGRHGCDPGRLKQLAAFGAVASTMTVPITAEATCLRVAFGQNVQTPATHEFCTAQPDRFDLIIAAGFLADSKKRKRVSEKAKKKKRKRVRKSEKG